MAVMGYVAFTLFMDADEQQTKIQEQKDERELGGGESLLGEIDMSRYTAPLAKLDNTQPLTLSNPHNLFNPVQWRKTPQGTVFKVEKGTEIGAGAIRLAKTYPLLTKVEFRSVAKSGNGFRYRFAVTREAAERKKDRIRMTTSVDGENLEDIRKIFTLVKVSGAPDDPTALTLRMSDGSDDITVVKGEIFSRVTATRQISPIRRPTSTFVTADRAKNFFLRKTCIISLQSTRARLYFPPPQRPSGRPSACNNQPSMFNNPVSCNRNEPLVSRGGFAVSGCYSPGAGGEDRNRAKKGGESRYGCVMGTHFGAGSRRASAWPSADRLVSCEPSAWPRVAHRVLKPCARS